MEIIERPAIQVVGILVEADAAGLEADVEQAWRDLDDRLEAIVGRTGTSLLQVRTELGDGRSRVLVGAQVDAGTPSPPDMEAELVYEARWIHDTHTGSLADVTTTFARMLDFAADEGVHADGVTMTVGHGAEATHDLYLRLG